ncbi:MAG: NUDIX domain-containing protein [Gracilibacteraceae bacterium]|jgi:8-oxo-dGTP diphosphatase|nr:NUDIX domain-containing protein [Gracilibacteraceae bacterium]
MINNPELWDVLDKDGNLTGRTIERGRPLKEGEYHLVVHIWIRNSKGEYLIQKRSSMVDVWPDIWSVAGGSAVKGENSLDAAFREVKEELGLTFERDAFKRLYRTRFKSVFSDLWLVCRDVSLKDIRIQKEEVSEVRYAGIEEIVSMIKRNEFIDFGEDYISYLADVL